MDTFGKVTFCLKDASLEPKQAIEQALRHSAKIKIDEAFLKDASTLKEGID